MKYILGLLFTLCVTSAVAQSTVKVCVPTGNGNSCQEVTASFPLPVGASNSFTNITTNTDTVIKSTPGTFAGLVINSASSLTGTVIIYNGACGSSPIGTFVTTAVASLPVNATASTSICARTDSGVTPADITILYK